MRILITGASSGLGEALALHYAQQHHDLILLARREVKLSAVAQACEALGSSVEVIVADMNDFAHIKTIGKRLATQKLDRIIFNAGVSIGHSCDITPFEDFYRLFQTNFLSLHALLEPLIPSLIGQKSGEIVFISSLASLFSMPSSIAYSSSKRAVNGYAQGLHHQLKPYNIQVMTILPGFIDSEMTRKNRFTMPFFLTTKQGVMRIVHAIETKKRFYPFPLRFYALIRLLNALPFWVQDRIVSRFTH